MASNFKITSYRTSGNLHIKLMGDFDGSSAWQLMNLLKKSSNGFHRVIIHTSCLNNIYPFGLHTFHQNLGDLKGDHTHLLFTGINASQISPKKDLCL